MRKLSLISLILLVLFSFTASGTDLKDYKKHGHRSDKWSPLVEAGIEAFDGGNPDAAMRFFSQAIKKGCKDGLVFFKIGLYYETREDLEKAKKYFSLAKTHLYKKYKSHPTTKNIHETLGRVLFSLGDIGAAKTELEKAVEVQGENFTLMFLLGSIASKAGDDSGIIHYYGKTLQHAPPEGTNSQQLLITIYVEIGKAHYNLSQFDKSLAIWNRLLQIAPKHPIARKYKETITRKQMKDSMKKSDQKILAQFGK